MHDITYVGMDAHKLSIAVAVLYPGRAEAVTFQIPNEVSAVRRMVRKIEREAPGEVRFCYEAGPCGYTLQRQIDASEKSSCAVIAPSMIPRKPGDKIKTDKRDALKLANLHKAGMLNEVVAPTPEDEAVRDLVRGRDDARADQVRCRNRISGFLLRRGLGYPGKKAWTAAHRRWLKALPFEDPADRALFDDYLLAFEQVEERLRGFDAHIEVVAQRERYARYVAWLRCFRGVDTLTAVSVLAELHDFERFRTARALMAFLGLVPSEYSSGQSSQRGPITRAGNKQVRRLLVQAAWQYRHRPAVKALRKRREGQPTQVIAIADRAQQRLNKRYNRMTAKGIPSQKVVVAIARELAGFIWAAMKHAA
jgi:transposase